MKINFFQYNPEEFYLERRKDYPIPKKLEEKDILEFSKNTDNLEYLKNLLHFSIFSSFFKATKFLLKKKELLMYINDYDRLINCVNFESFKSERRRMLNLIFKYSNYSKREKYGIRKYYGLNSCNILCYF